MAWKQISGGEDGSIIYWVDTITGASSLSKPFNYSGAGSWSNNFSVANEFDNKSFYGATGSVGKLLADAASAAGLSNFDFNKAAADAAPGFGWALPGGSGWLLGANDVQIFNNILDRTGNDALKAYQLDANGASFQTAKNAGIQRDAELKIKNDNMEGMNAGLLKAGLVIGGLIAGGSALANTSLFGASGSGIAAAIDAQDAAWGAWASGNAAGAGSGFAAALDAQDAAWGAQAASGANSWMAIPSASSITSAISAANTASTLKTATDALTSAGKVAGAAATLATVAAGTGAKSLTGTTAATPTRAFASVPLNSGGDSATQSSSSASSWINAGIIAVGVIGVGLVAAAFYKG